MLGPRYHAFDDILLAFFMAFNASAVLSHRLENFWAVLMLKIFSDIPLGFRRESCSVRSGIHADFKSMLILVDSL